MAWFGRLGFVKSCDPLFGAMSPMCCKYFSTKCLLVGEFIWPMSECEWEVDMWKPLCQRLSMGPHSRPQIRSAPYSGLCIPGASYRIFGLVCTPSWWGCSEQPFRQFNIRHQFPKCAKLLWPKSGQGRAGRAMSIPVMWRKSGQTEGWNTCPSIKAAAEELCISRSKLSLHCREGTPIEGYEVQFAPPTELEVLDGEKWLPMKSPRTRRDVAGRQISSYGRIKASNGLISRGCRVKAGYFRARIQDHYDRHAVYIHSLVAYNFLGPPPSSQHSQVNHKDLNPGNNHVENLEYVTPAENINHFHANRGYQLSKPGAQVPVLGRPRGGSEEGWVWYKSMKDAAQILGVQRPNIWKCTRGLRKHTGGYEFRLAESAEPLQLPGEEWRPVNLEGLLRERAKRMRRTRMNHCNRWWFLLALVAYPFLGPAANPQEWQQLHGGTEDL